MTNTTIDLPPSAFSTASYNHLRGSGKKTWYTRYKAAIKSHYGKPKGYVKK